MSKKKRPPVEPPKKPVGNPPWIPDAQILKKVEQMASDGMYEKDIAACIGISVSTYMAKKHEFPELAEAVKRGNSKGVQFATECLRVLMPDNLTAIIFYLKCKAGWKDDGTNVGAGGGRDTEASTRAVRAALDRIKQQRPACG